MSRSVYLIMNEKGTVPFDVRWRWYGSMTVQTYFASNPGVGAVSALSGNQLFFRAGAVSTTDLAGNAGSFMHELLHNAGYDDSTLKNALGFSDGQVSAKVSRRLAMDCFGAQ